MLERLVNFKKMVHFFEDMAGELTEVCIDVVGRLAEGDGDDFFVGLAVVHHVYYAYRIALHERRGQDRFAAQNEHVERIAVVGERARNKAVTCRIYGGSVQNSVQFEHSGGLIQLVFTLGTLLDLDITHKIVGFYAFFRNIVPNIHRNYLLFLLF